MAGLSGVVIGKGAPLAKWGLRPGMPQRVASLPLASKGGVVPVAQGKNAVFKAISLVFGTERCDREDRKRTLMKA